MEITLDFEAMLEVVRRRAGRWRELIADEMEEREREERECQEYDVIGEEEVDEEAWEMV